MTGAPTPPPVRGPALRFRARVAVLAGRLVAGASRLARFGSGAVIGGRVSLLIDPRLLEDLTADRDVVVVSATNGKTTTTRLTAAAIGSSRAVVSNWRGANMTPGIVAALGGARADATAVLEVDERWLETVLPDTAASLVLLLNLSRDQLDRTQEVRKIAGRWRAALERTPTTVVANADDPLVAWAAAGAARVVWIATGLEWTADASGCPACAGRIVFDADGWRCPTCGLERPSPDVRVGDGVIDFADTSVRPTSPLPGRVNLVNAAFAISAAREVGVDPQAACSALDDVHEIAGRYRRAEIDGVAIRQLLAKNPAGWHEALDMLEPGPAIVAINARIADGHDPSWLWDVDFEALRGRTVVAIGDRRLDLAVRLAYAGVDHVLADDLRSAVALARRSSGWSPERPIDVVANYTAFRDHLALTGGVV